MVLVDELLKRTFSARGEARGRTQEINSILADSTLDLSPEQRQRLEQRRDEQERDK